MMTDVVSPEKRNRALVARRVLSDYAEAEDLITIGAYKEGQNPKVDFAVKNYPALQVFLTQHPEEKVSLEDADTQLKQIFG